MKKLLLTLACACFAFGASAKLVKGNPAVDASKEVHIASSDLDGVTVVATSLDGKSILTVDDADGHHEHAVTAVSALDVTNHYYLWKFKKITDAADCGVDGDLYLIQMMNDEGKNFSIWGTPGYINFQQEGKNAMYAGGLEGWSDPKKTYGQDQNYCALWKVTYNEDLKAYSFMNVGRENHEYLSPTKNGPVAEETFVKLYH